MTLENKLDTLKEEILSIETMHTSIMGSVKELLQKDLIVGEDEGKEIDIMEE